MHTLQISPDGNDAWSGRFAAPYSARTDGPLTSLAGTRKVLLLLFEAGGFHSPVEVRIAPGLYEMDRPVTFDVPFPQPVTFRASEPGTAVFSGSRKIKTWHPTTFTPSARVCSPTWAASTPSACSPEPSSAAT